MTQTLPKPATSLTTVANNMLSDLSRIRWTRRKLSHGLELLLERTDIHRYRLTAAREVSQPSDVELKILTVAFGLPQTTQWQRRIAERKRNNGDGTQRIYLNSLHVAECTWADD